VVVDECATVDVVDEGPGVPAAVEARLFEPSFAVSAGNGLGLVLTREIMHAHGGDVRLLPTEQGARFRLDFPRSANGRALP
jgi:signal transduction histidine kinase